MLPIDVKKVIQVAKETYNEQAAEEKKKKVSCSQQALANQLVSQNLMGMNGGAQPMGMATQEQ